MKCTDRELLEKLRWLKERADQRRQRLRPLQERTPTGVVPVRADTPPTLLRSHEFSSAPEAESHAHGAAPESGPDDSIPPLWARSLTGVGTPPVRELR